MQIPPSNSHFPTTLRMRTIPQTCNQAKERHWGEEAVAVGVTGRDLERWREGDDGG